MDEAATARAQAYADAAFLRVLTLALGSCEELRVAFAAASTRLLQRLRQDGETADVIEGVDARCQWLTRSIPSVRRPEPAAVPAEPASGLITK